ncbi:MAG: diacylglycerol kinase family protein [Candidatus Marinimicrobia bacterium]|nr:diacylglycerol kinase family protein [Candidatus Neomarinimicrobiota bacterium]
MGGLIAALTQKPELFFITNLLAGGGKARKRWRVFIEESKNREFRINCHPTEYPGHAIELAKQAVDKGIKRIVVFGGDGTLNEVLNGIIQDDRLIDPEIQLVFLGAGSSCDVEKLFPDRLRLPERVLSEKSYVVDVAKVICNDPSGNQIARYFLANSSVGVISQSIVAFNRKTVIMSFLKRLNIDVAALFAGFRNVFQFGNFSADVTIDQTEHLSRSLKNLTVFKCSYFGGGMNYGVPSACDDGKLHIALINKMGRIKTLSYIPSLYSGSVFKKANAEYHQGYTIKLSGENLTVAVETDGEIIGTPPCEYSILPKMLHLVL